MTVSALRMPKRPRGVHMAADFWKILMVSAALFLVACASEKLAFPNDSVFSLVRYGNSDLPALAPGSASPGRAIYVLSGQITADADGSYTSHRVVRVVRDDQVSEVEQTSTGRYELKNSQMLLSHEGCPQQTVLTISRDGEFLSGLRAACEGLDIETHVEYRRIQ